MYNLLVTLEADAWEGPSKADVFNGPSNTYRFSKARFLEYTDETLIARFRSLTPAAIAELCSLPTLFAYEESVQQAARVGRITQIAEEGAEIVLTFEIDAKSPLVSHDVLSSKSSDFGISGYELDRTHWAVKDVIPPPIARALSRTNTNPTALTAGRAILDAAEPFDVVVRATSIHVEPRRLASIPWPAGTVGLDESHDGPWPQPVLLECSWKDGKTQLLASIARAGGR